MKTWPHQNWKVVITVNITFNSINLRHLKSTRALLNTTWYHYFVHNDFKQQVLTSRRNYYRKKSKAGLWEVVYITVSCPLQI